MFPAASPNAAALFNSMAGTPSTLDFHRTALNAHKKPDPFTNPLATSAPTTQGQMPAMTASTHQPQARQQFGQHDNDAANGLFLLAQAGNESHASSQFAVPPLPSHNAADEAARRRARTNARSIGSMPGSLRAQSELSQDASDGTETKPSNRVRGKKAANGKGSKARKTEDTPPKQPAAKKGKANNGAAISNHQFEDENDEDEDEAMKEDQYHENGKKMTDEEKRKNFLERNR